MTLSFQKFMLQESYARMINILRGDVPHVKTMAFITGWNPMGITATPEQNNKANEQLKSALKQSIRPTFASKGIDPFHVFPINYKKIMGKYGDIEKSFLVLHIDRETIIKYAAMFKQKAVIFGSKKKDEHGQDYIDFEWIETNKENPEEVTPESYSTVDHRSVVVAGEAGRSPEGFFSAPPFPLKLKTADKGKKTGEPKAFRIPFFDDSYAGAKYTQGKRDIEFPVKKLPTQEPELATGTENYDLGIEIDVPVSFVSSELPNTEKINNLVEEIHHYADILDDAKYTEKHKWMTRAHLSEKIQELNQAIK